MQRKGKALRQLPPGDRRRLADFRNAWRKMDHDQRIAALQWLTTDAKDDGVSVAHVDIAFPPRPMREPQVD